MLRLFSSRSAVLAGALLIGAAVVVTVNLGREDGENPDDSATPAARERGGSAGPRLAARDRQYPTSKRKRKGLSAEQVRDRLPASDDPGALRFATGRKLPEEIALLFRKLGKLEGEAALDEIVSRYGEAGHYAAAALTQAILGWMEVDREAAIAAFREMITPAATEGTRIAQDLVCWKGTCLISGFG